jgi:hypothetical protein
MQAKEGRAYFPRPFFAPTAKDFDHALASTATLYLNAAAQCRGQKKTPLDEEWGLTSN